ncbi:MAG: 3-phosphoshikimate 1-carboxyvinyltransferase [Bacteroidales bacterium]|nr:3-phosphoshikimate 1-carboxyvinyltransferase [Bacteroidales bacterium]
MNVKINIPYLNGQWTAPSSKSELIRFIAIAMQCEETSTLNNVTWCNDSYAMLNTAEAWGADIELSENRLQIKGCIEPQSHEFNTGESALCLRLMIPILACHKGTYKLQAEGTLLNRPVGEIENIIKQLGAHIQTNQNFPPITITGSIQAGSLTIENPITSQNLSGLLMALPLLKDNSRIAVNKLISQPYIKLTLSCLQQAGINITVNSMFNEFIIQGNQAFKPISTSIEGDWSAASLFLVAAAINGQLRLKNLNPQSLQADKAILNFISTKYDHQYHCRKQAIQAFEADITHCPDLFPALMVLALNANNSCKITGINRLLYKESNRIDKFIEEFSKFGGKYSIQGDILHIRPPEKIDSATINAHNDHRIAMAAAMATIGSDADATIVGAECVNKSYPSFWEDLQCLGANLSINN